MPASARAADFAIGLLNHDRMSFELTPRLLWKAFSTTETRLWVYRPRSAEHEGRQTQTQFISGYLEALAFISSERLPDPRTRR